VVVEGSLLTVAVNLVTVPTLWPGRLPSRIGEVYFARQRYAAFFDTAAELAAGQPTIIFVEPDPADRHLDYVVNDPSLDGPVLIARYRPDRMDLNEARALFPDRQAFLFRVAGARDTPPLTRGPHGVQIAGRVPLAPPVHRKGLRACVARRSRGTWVRSLNSTLVTT
jgi:hypothetical protein